MTKLAATTPASMSFAFLLLVLAVASGGASASRLLRLPGATGKKYLTKQEHWFNQTLDHFSPYDHRYFGQRYYEYLDNFRAPDGPIFLKICGESACSGIASDYISVLAKKFGAAVVSLEHRYYGKSSPFKSLTTENLRFLSSKQALFDLAAFRQYYQDSLNAKFNRSNIDNSWFVFGVSYSGALSAWFRLKFPHLTCGSLASSAVVQAIHNFTAFDKQVGESAGPECKSVLQEITRLVDQRLGSNAKAVKTLFNATELKNDGDFLYFLADAAVIAIQYGNPDRLCIPLIEAKKAGADLVEAYATYVKDYYVGSFGVSVQTYNQEHLKKTKLTDDTSDRFVVVPSLYRSSIFSGSRIIFTNGSQDPWRHASKQTSSPEMPSFIITCHNCGHGTDFRGCPQSPLVPEGDSGNCSNPDAVRKVRQQIIQTIDWWLSECSTSPGRSSM
ncbi:UNVERIFIED_CONTAM: putative serine protease EDA2 [Sesamum latifolium]|uniref:Serine protease EDA2 n=1 Tax=Sesamum latifolium TaxID=2727402 RepID=A0AAW2X4W5_9LAMI